MQFIGAAVTDIGISKQTNQDSVCVKIAKTKKCGCAHRATISFN